MRNFMYLFFIISVLASCGDDANMDSGTNPDTTDPMDENNDPGDDNTTGQLSFKITDAPIDNAEVKSCVVTIQEIHVDGQKVDGFQKTSVDLLAYQRGESLVLGTFDIEAKQYSKIDLVLDFDEDATGAKPGCRVEEQDGVVHAMSLASNTVTLENQFTVEEGTPSTLVFDVDLRKSVSVEEDNAGNVSYNFVTAAELSTAVRVLQEGQTGIIKGSTQNTTNNDAKIVAYAYHKGQFDDAVELSGQGESRIQFANAVNSTVCDDEGNFELHFLEEGEYDLYFAAYDQDSKGRVSLKGMFSVGGLVSTALSPVSVTTKANSTATVEVTLQGLLGL